MMGLLGSLYINYNQMLFSHFVSVPGDIGDSRLIIYLLNHWYNVFCGDNSFFSLNYFYPDKLVLGYSDALFLLGIFYSFFRLFGFDYFASLQLLFIFMTIVAYLTSYFVLRRLLKLDLFFSILGSILLVSLNAMQLQVGHAQLLGFYFYPTLIILLWLYINADKNKLKSWLCLGGFSLLLGGVYFTSYYPAWLFLFTLILFAIVYLMLSLFNTSFKELFSNIITFIINNKFQLLYGILLFFVALIPFLITYLPIIALGRHFSYSEVLLFSPRIKDVINVGASNYLYSLLLKAYVYDFGNLEIQAGYPFILIISFLAFLVYYFISFFQKKPLIRPIIFSIGLTAIIIIILVIKLTAHFSLWYIIYNIIPGASALRAIGRYMIVSQMLAVVFVMYGLNKFYDGAKRSVLISYYRVKFGLLIALVVVAAVLVIEQYNNKLYGLDKSEQMLFLHRIHSPPSDCSVFFVKRIDTPQRPLWSYQMDALMISMALDMPTINGHSGQLPPGWALNDPSGLLYYQNIDSWLKANRVNYEDVCSVDIYNGDFQHVTAEGLVDDSVAILSRNIQTIRKAVAQYVANKHSLLDLTPSQLRELTWPSKVVGGFQIVDDATNLTKNGYWIGAWGGDSSYAIGYAPVSGAIAAAMHDLYARETKTIYFPYPKVYSSRMSHNLHQSGQILMVFNKPKHETIPHDSLMIDFSTKGSSSSSSIESTGLCGSENWGTWSCSNYVQIRFALDHPNPQLYLALTFNAFVNERHTQTFEFYLNGKLLGRQTYSTSENNREVFDISSLAVKGNNIFGIKIPDAAAPKSLGVNPDTRNLGLGLIGLEISHEK